jgi:capsular polysaccharide biosynthesis protein
MKLSRLGPAVPPLDPELPRWLLALGSAIAVLGAAAGIAVLLELLDPVVLARSDVEKLTGMPALGELPRAR